MQIKPAELGKVIESHQRMVFSIALLLTGDYSVAEEVAQDTFLDLFRSAEQLVNEDHVRFWLCRVTVHRAMDAIRRRSRQPESLAEEWSPEKHDCALEERDGEETNLSMSARIQELLQALPEPMRVAVVLRYQEDMAPDAIARLLGQPVATVKSHLQRGLKLLRKKAAVTMRAYIR